MSPWSACALSLVVLGSLCAGDVPGYRGGHRLRSRTAVLSSQSAFPSIAATQTQSGEIQWIDTTNLFVQGSASALIFPLNAGDATGYLIGTGFGFSVPANATILGVEAEVFWYDSNFGTGPHAVQDEIRLWYAGGTIGANKSTYADIPIPPPTSTVFGSPTDTWSTTLTPAIVNSPTFGMAFKAYHADTGQAGSSIDIDAFKITVYY